MSTKLSHRNNKGVNNHSLYQTNILADHTELLTNIKDNTADLDINTDGLEGALTDGTQKTQVLGNTSADGSGDSLNMLVNSSGRLQCDIIDGSAPLKTFTYQTDPSETLTSAQSVERGFTIIAGCDQINGNFDQINPLQVDSNGKITISNIALATATQTPADTAYKQKVFLGLHDVSNSVIRTARSDASGNLKVSIEAGGSTADSTAANQLTTHSKLDTIETTLNDIETNTDKITSGSDATLSSAQQVLIYGLDNHNNLDAIKVNTQGALKVIQDSSENKGSTGNLVNNSSLASGALSSAVNISDFNRANIAVEDSSITVFDDYEILVSENDSNYYLLDSIFTTVRNSKREGTLKNQSLHGWKYLKIKNNSSTDSYSNVVATVVGTPN
jgi:hypothetical protein